jgi:hypothetical protein
MTEFSFPCVSVSSSAGEYYQVCFGDGEDPDEAYFLIQRQFEDYDGGYFYVEGAQRIAERAFQNQKGGTGKGFVAAGNHVPAG